MSLSGKRIVNGTFEPSEHLEDDVTVFVEDTALVDGSQRFFDAQSNVIPESSASAPRRPSDVGSIPLKPLVGVGLLLFCHE